MEIDIDFTRFIFALFCGYFLTLSGSLSQLVTNNTIASPSTLGMDGAAVLFVIFSQFFTLGSSLDISYVHTAFILFLIPFCIISFFSLNSKKKISNIWEHFDIQKIILFGLAFNLFVGAIFSIIQFLFMALNFEFPTGLWFGSLKQYDESYLLVFVAVFILTKVYILGVSQKFEALNLGSSFALGLGIDVQRIQRIALLLSFLLTGVVICYFGVFSFLGLIFPHILRSFKFFKSNMKRELLIGPYITGLIFALVDQSCYQFDVYGAELPVGMVSSVVGAIFLIFLVLKSKISRA
jgi:iron complex transport system permease protein